jgi:hypothetical protein
MSSFIIDNVVVTSYGKYGHRICRIEWYERKLGLSANKLMKIKTGTRLGDNIIITKLADGVISIDDIINSWNQGKIQELIPW